MILFFKVPLGKPFEKVLPIQKKMRVGGSGRLNPLPPFPQVPLEASGVLADNIQAKLFLLQIKVIGRKVRTLIVINK